MAFSVASGSGSSLLTAVVGTCGWGGTGKVALAEGSACGCGCSSTTVAGSASDSVFAASGVGELAEFEVGNSLISVAGRVFSGVGLSAAIATFSGASARFSKAGESE